MKRQTNRKFYIALPICVLLCFLLWLLEMPPEAGWRVDMPDIFTWGLAETVLQMASGAFLCFFAVHERLRRSFIELMIVSVLATVAIFTVTDTLLHFYLLGPFPYLLAALLYFWHVADVSKIKLAFILTVAAGYLLMFGGVLSIFDQPGKNDVEWIVTWQSVGISVLMNALILPPAAWMMRKKLWPAMRDMGTVEFRFLLPAAVIFLVFELFFSQAFSFITFKYDWIRVALAVVLGATTFTMMILMITVLKKSSDHAAARERELALLEENARKQSLLERAGQKPGQVITKGALSLDTISSQAFLNGEDMLLSPKEFSLFAVFFQHENEVLTREFLYQAAWSQPMTDDANALKKTVSRLRGKLAGSGFTIAPKRGEGYSFTKKT